MRVLMVHNRYRSAMPSGENMAVDQDVELLRENGVEVETFMPSSDSIATMSLAQKAATAIGPVYNAGGVREFRCRLESFKPDVVHVHNVFPLISPSVVNVAADRRVPVVQTLHNYRHSCVNGLHLRNGKICTDCVGSRTKWPALAHGCYRGSRTQTIPMVASRLAHRRTWQRVNIFIALNDFMRDRAVEAGLPPERIRLRPNWGRDPGPPFSLGGDVLFLGRLSEEKGVPLLLDAWQLIDKTSGVHLRVVGDGPLRDLVYERAEGDQTILPLGSLGPKDIVAEFRAARLVVIPSICYEAEPRVFVEALSHGRPVIGLTTCALASSLTSGVGWTADPNPHSLSTRIAYALGRVGPRQVTATRKTFQASHTPEFAFAALARIYALSASEEGCESRLLPQHYDEAPPRHA